MTESRSKKLLLEAITGNKKLLVIAPGITTSISVYLIFLSSIIIDSILLYYLYCSYGTHTTSLGISGAGAGPLQLHRVVLGPIVLLDRESGPRDAPKAKFWRLN